MSLSEIREKVNEIGYAWEQYKAVNEERIKNLERKNTEDPLTLEQLSTIGKVIDNCQNRIERLEIEKRRPGFGATIADSDPYNKQFEDYLRKGVAPTLQPKSYPIPYSAFNPEYGSVLMSPKMADTILKNMETAYALRQLIPAENISSTSLEIIVDKDRFSLSSSAWAQEIVIPNSVSTTDATKITKLTVPTYILYVLPLATQQFVEDMSTRFTGWFTEKILDTFSHEEEKTFINGSGVDRPKGFLRYPISEAGGSDYILEIKSGVDGGITTESVFKLLYSLNERHCTRGSLLMHRRTMELIRPLVYNDQPLWQPAYASSDGRETILGVPVYFSSYMPTPDAGNHAVLFGNFKECALIVDRYTMRVRQDPYSYKPLYSWLTSKRCGFAVLYCDGFAVLRLSA